MKKLRFAIVIVVGVLMGAGAIAPPTVHAQFKDIVTLKEALKECLQSEGAASLLKQTFTLTDEQKAAVKKEFGIDAADSYLMYTGIDKEKAAIGTAVVVNVAGKEGPIQMVVAMRPETGEVYNLGFTVFGEERGKPAATPAYLKQFIGADMEKPFLPGKDVDAVTGATQTSWSVNEAVKTAVRMYHYLVVRGEGEESS